MINSTSTSTSQCFQGGTKLLLWLRLASSYLPCGGTLCPCPAVPSSPSPRGLVAPRFKFLSAQHAAGSAPPLRHWPQPSTVTEVTSTGSGKQSSVRPSSESRAAGRREGPAAMALATGIPEPGSGWGPASTVTLGPQGPGSRENRGRSPLAGARALSCATRFHRPRPAPPSPA